MLVKNPAARYSPSQSQGLNSVSRPTTLVVVVVVIIIIIIITIIIIIIIIIITVIRIERRGLCHHRLLDTF